jgi:DNA-binding NarL/FixJ family response regulator
MIRVLVVDDHALVRRGVVLILQETPDIVVAGEAASGREALQAIQAGDYDLVLLDVAMPDGGGLEILQRIRALKPGLPVLFLSIYPEKQYAQRALKASAAGYMTKESAPEELIAAVRQVARGGKYITQTLAQQLAAELGSETSKEPHEMLSNREYQVLRLLGAGQSVGEIAAELSLSVKTVSTYRARILQKLGLQTTAELIRYALERGLVD